MSKEPVEDEDDVFIENLNSALLLSLGILSVSASGILLVYSAAAVVYGQQLLMDFLERAVFAGLLFVIGSGSLQFFRKRRESGKKKQSTLFFRVKPS